MFYEVDSRECKMLKKKSQVAKYKHSRKLLHHFYDQNSALRYRNLNSEHRKLAANISR